MSGSAPIRIDSRPSETSREEWDSRVELAACYRIFDLLGWTEMIFNHITLRVPGPERHFLINPYGLWYREVTASNLVKVDLEGNLIGASEWPVNRAGFVIHSAIHAAREDAHCIMHTHTTAGMAIACQRDGLASDNFYSALIHGQVAYHDFEGVTVRDDEKPRLVRSLGDKSYMILRNHGLLVCGRTVPEALLRMWTIERACQVQCAAQATGRPLIELPDDVLERAVEDATRARAWRPDGSQALRSAPAPRRGNRSELPNLRVAHCTLRGSEGIAGQRHSTRTLFGAPRALRGRLHRESEVFGDLSYHADRRRAGSLRRGVHRRGRCAVQRRSRRRSGPGSISTARCLRSCSPARGSSPRSSISADPRAPGARRRSGARRGCRARSSYCPRSWLSSCCTRSLTSSAGTGPTARLRAASATRRSSSAPSVRCLRSRSMFAPA